MSETAEINPLASGVATWRELEACADDYDIRAQACDRIPINVIGNGDQWRVRAQRLRKLAAKLRASHCTTTAGSTPAVPERTERQRLCRYNCGTPPNDAHAPDEACAVCRDLASRAAVPERGEETEAAEIRVGMLRDVKHRSTATLRRLGYDGLADALNQAVESFIRAARPEGEDARRMDEGELRATFQDLAECITLRDSMGGTITYEASEEPGVYLVRGAYRVGNSMGQGGWRILSTPTRSERDG